MPFLPGTVPQVFSQWALYFYKDQRLRRWSSNGGNSRVEYRSRAAWLPRSLRNDNTWEKETNSSLISTKSSCLPLASILLVGMSSILHTGMWVFGRLHNLHKVTLSEGQSCDQNLDQCDYQVCVLSIQSGRGGNTHTHTHTHTHIHTHTHTIRLLLC